MAAAVPRDRRRVKERPMKRSSLLYLILSTALLAGLAHLRSDWLGDAAPRPESAPVRAVERLAADAAWPTRHNEAHSWWFLLRQ
jgi:hypothetical protein